MKLKYFSLCWVFMVVSYVNVFSQQTYDPNGLNQQQPGQNQQSNFSDSTAVEDTVQRPKEPFSWKNNPKVATIASLILPGAGQFYNKKYWKVPLVWICMSAAGYFYFYNDDRYNDFREAYIYYQYKNPNESGYPAITKKEAYDGYTDIAQKYPRIMSDFDVRTDSVNNLNTIQANRNYAQTNRDYMMILVAFAYICNLMDAAVDAHFSKFDVSDNLSMKIDPTFVSPTGMPQLGMSLTMNFIDPRSKYKHKLIKTGY